MANRSHLTTLGKIENGWTVENLGWILTSVSENLFNNTQRRKELILNQPKIKFKSLKSSKITTSPWTYFSYRYLSHWSTRTSFTNSIEWIFMCIREWKSECCLTCCGSCCSHCCACCSWCSHCCTYKYGISDYASFSI